MATNRKTAVKAAIPTTGTAAGGLSTDELKKINAYWRDCNYLSAGVIYLRANPLLREKLKPEHIKVRLLGHWGASPGLSFAYVHLNRLIVKHDLDVIFLTGPGHGAPGVIGPAYLEGTESEVYPNKSEDGAGMREFFKEFSFPGGPPQHADRLPAIRLRARRGQARDRSVEVAVEVKRVSANHEITLRGAVRQGVGALRLAWA